MREHARRRMSLKGCGAKEETINVEVLLDTVASPSFISEACVEDFGVRVV